MVLFIKKKKKKKSYSPFTLTTYKSCGRRFTEFSHGDQIGSTAPKYSQHYTN